MTQENKELLLKDLCARLPYWVKCEMIDRLRIVNNEPEPSYESVLFPKHIELFSYHNNFIIRPYLRPMSSMTEEERKEYWDITSVNNHCAAIDWLNKNMFDYRGLIKKGLTLEAPEGMYNIKEK